MYPRVVTVTVCKCGERVRRKKQKGGPDWAASEGAREPRLGAAPEMARFQRLDEDLAARGAGRRRDPLGEPFVPAGRCEGSILHSTVFQKRRREGVTLRTVVVDGGC
jgi:hypothetical protein